LDIPVHRTTEQNPFNGLNLTETFVWNKKKENKMKQQHEEDVSLLDVKDVSSNATLLLDDTATRKEKAKDIVSSIQEIDKLGNRRQAREEQRMEMERPTILSVSPPLYCRSIPGNLFFQIKC
jgi:hypothetical protein